MKVLRALAKGWLLLFWCDTALSLVDQAVALPTGIHLLGPVQGVTGALAVLGLPLVWLAVGLAPSLPIGVFLPPLAFTAWVLLGAAPASILLYDGPWFLPTVAGLQAVVAAWSAWRVHRIERRDRWLLVEDVPGETARWPRLAAWAGAHAVLVPPLLAAYAYASVDLALRRTTGGFVSLGLDGVRVAHREYARGERTVDLVGMIHLGERSAYESLFAPIPVEGTVVLEEGVRDVGGLLPGGPVYERLAGGLGVEMQAPIGEMSALETRNADLDVSEFDEDTVKFLRKVFAVYTADDPVAAMLDYLIYVRAQPDRAALLDGVMHDILERRNEHLLEQLDLALDDHARVVVPWGAYHLPDIEAAVLGRGFTEQRRRTVTLIPFRVAD